MPFSEAAQDLLQRPITLERLELLELAVPQVEAFRSAIGERRERRALYVRWYDTDGAWGIGECSCRPDPFFNGEFVAGARQVLRDHVLPVLARQATLADLHQQAQRFRGWPFTLAALLDAAWDLGRRRGDADLLTHLEPPRLDAVPVGISLGIFDTPDEAVERVRSAVAEGYPRVKMKIAPSMDPAPLAAVREAFPDLHLGFDANGSCTDDDIPFLVGLGDLNPAMLEQPFAPTRLDHCLELRRQAPELPICLDESIVDLGSLVTAHRLGALDEVNLKPGRVGGQQQVCEILAYCRTEGIPVWIGGMFETGIGRNANLRVAARLPDAEAHDLSPSQRYFTRDVVQDPAVMDNGRVAIVDDMPPVIDEDAFADLLVQRDVLPLDKGK